MSRKRLFAVTLAVVLVGGSSAGGAAPAVEDPVVSTPGNEVAFRRDCADAEPYQVRAYAALRSEGGRAQALARVLAWRHAVQRDEVFVSLELVALELDAGSEWADAPFAMRMDASAGTGRRIVGTDYTEYGANTEPGVGEVRAFRADAAGRMAWLDFVEPTERGTLFDRLHNHAPDMRVSGTELGLSDSERRVSLGLTLTHGRSGEEIRLAGPAVRVPDRIWRATPPEPRAMGFLATINPFDEASVWAWLGNSVRYRHCVEERREAKRWFAAGAMPEKSGPDSGPAGGGHSTVTNPGLE